MQSILLAFRTSLQIQYYRLVLSLLPVWMIFLCTSTAQDRPIVIQFMVPPPYPAFFAQYQDKLNDVVFSIANTSGSPYQLYFHAEITRSTGERIATRPDYKPPQAFHIGAFETTMLTLQDIAELNAAFTLSNTDIYGFDITLIERYGIIPEGTYTICIQALDFVTDELRSAPGTGCSNTFQVTHAMPPRLTGPATGYNFCEDFGLLLLSWTPVIQEPGSMIVYDLEIIDLTALGLSGEDPLLPFVDGAPRFYTVEDILVPQYSYAIGTVDPPFEPGHKYAWRVRARDLMHTIFIQDDGYSEVFTFDYCPISGTVSIENVYPKDKDTIPFNFPYLAMRFTPQNEQYDRLTYELMIHGPGVAINRSHNVHWGDTGPAARTRSAWSDATDDQCRTIPLLRVDDVPPFQRGKQYRWNANVTIHQGPAEHYANIVAQYFTYGMPKPRLVKPADRDSLHPSDLEHYQFEFTKGNLKSSYLPPHTMLQLNNAHTSPAYQEIISQAHEAWILEIYKDDSTCTQADKRVVRITEEIQKFLPQRGEIDKDEFKEVLEKAIKKQIHGAYEAGSITDATYFWRVGWLSHPGDSERLNEVYLWSSINRFVLDSNREPASPPSERTDCMEDCEIEQPSDRTTKKTLAAGNRVKVGRFEMEIRHLTNPGASNQVYHGSGVIEIPFLNQVKVRVDFQSLIVNDASEMYSGAVNTVKDDPLFDVGVESIAGLNIPELDSARMTQLNHVLQVGGRMVGMMAPGSETGLPLGFDHDFETTAIALGIVEMDFTPTGAKLNAVLNMHFPEIREDFNIGFGAAEICFHPEGINTENANLYLARDIVIPFETDDEDDPVLIKFKGLSHPEFEYSRRNVTHIRFDCNGFKDGQVHVEVTFPRSVFTPENPDGTEKEGNLKATATGMFDARGGFLIGLNFSDRFYYTDWDEASFEVSQAWLDLSTTANPTGFSFPQGYSDRALSNPPSSSMSNAWKGFYMDNLSVSFKHFQKKRSVYGENQRVTFGIRGVMFDHTGFSGRFYTANLVSWTEHEEEIAGWAFALDTVEIAFASNNLISGSVAARLGFPLDDTQFLKCKLTLAYDHEKSKFKFTAVVKPEDTFSVEAWVAQLELDRSSKVELTISSDVKVKVELTGNITITTDFREDLEDMPGSFSFPELRFERIIISSDRGFEGGTINNRSLTGLGGGSGGSGSGAGTSPGSGNNGQRVANFPIDLNGISLNANPPNELILGVDIGITFTNDGSGLSASTVLNFIGTYEFSEARFTDFRVELETIRIDLSFDPVEIKGSLTIKKENLPGGGYLERFSGKLDMKLPAGLKGKLEGEYGTYAANPEAPYGSPEHFGFFRIDGRVTGFSITLTPWMAVTGFGGGFYHRMKISDPCTMPRVNPSDPPAGGPSPEAAVIPSGATYDIDYATLFGFRVMVQAAFPSNDEVYNLDVSLGAEVAEDASGSIILQRLDFQGDVYVMTKVADRASPRIYAALNIAYLNPPGETPLISGNFELYVDIKFRGLEILKGNMDPASDIFPNCFNLTNAGCGCRAVAARLYIPLDDTAADAWYFYMGHWSPERPFADRGSLMLKIVDLLRIEIKHYLMAGNGLPNDLPPPPPQIRDLIYGPPSGDGSPEARAAMAAESSRVAGRLSAPRPSMTAAGFAMGAYLDAHTRLDFAIFYAAFSLTIGFDINITTSEVECWNETRTDTYMRGMDGWYGQGQAYIGMRGDLGVQVNLGFIQGEFSIVELAAAVMLQAGLPNPEYFRGRVGLRYSILNGMISGHCNFKIDIGNKCEAVQPNPLGVEMISDMQPDGGEDLSVFTTVAASFNFPVNEILTFEEEVDYDETVLRYIQVFIHNFEIREQHATTGRIVPNNLRIEERGVLAKAVPRRWMEPEMMHYSTITVRAREYPNRFSSTGNLIVMSGSPWEESKTVSFRTGPRPDFIPDENVHYTYPLDGQRFYLQREGIPHLRLNVAMPGLLIEEQHGRQYKHYLRLIALETHDTLAVELPLSIDRNVAWIYPGFYFPQLEPETHYCLQIVRTPYTPPVAGTSGLASINLPPGALEGSIYNQLGTETIRRLVDLGISESIYGGGAPTAEVEEVKIVGSEIAHDEHLIYRYYFRTSRFDRLSDKLSGVSLDVQQSSNLLMSLQGDFQEFFDVFDINGFVKSGVRRLRPLVLLSKHTTSNTFNNRVSGDYHTYRDLTEFMRSVNPFFRSRAADLLYRNPARGIYRVGIPPSDVVVVRSNRVQPPLSETELIGVSTPPQTTTSNPFAAVQTSLGPLIGGPGITIDPSLLQPAPPVYFDYTDAIWVTMQHQDMKTKISRLLNEFHFYFGGYVFRNHLDTNPSLRARVHNFRNRSLSHFHFTPGTYGIHFASRPPSPFSSGVWRGTDINKTFVR